MTGTAGDRSCGAAAGTTVPVGVLLMTFGSAVTADDVPAYLASVRGGRPAPPDVVEEFRRRFRRIGRSPLIDITLAQGEALQALLDAEHGPGAYQVAVGMRHSAPTIDDAVGRLARGGVRRIVGVVLSPQFSPIIMGGYSVALAAAVQRRSPALDAVVAPAWHLCEPFIRTLAARLQEALADLPADARARTTVIFTAHSLPRAVVDRDPQYIDQLWATADAVAEHAGIPAEQRITAYQSAGHTPEEWLKPDVKDLFGGLRDAGRQSVLVVPVQFLSDHLEVLYDIDVAAREEAEAAGMHLHRIEMPNLAEGFIRTLAEVVARETRTASTTA